ncbi:hypothetical protein [Nocardia sp. NPDC020380]|uniref:hypothetical protein n=1 Tax=Nocardia sp. NPDC020380 TaxID=3364309 RepID=UPI00379AB545
MRWIAIGAAMLAAATACGTGPSGPVSASGGSPSAGSTTAGSAAPEVNPQGDIPDSTVYVPYSYAAGHFTVKVPQGWARSNQGAAVVFTDKLNSVRLEAAPATQAPTVESARATEVPAIQAAAGNIHVDGVTSVQRAGGTVVRISYSADSPPDAVTGKVVRDAVERYEYFHNGTEAIVTLSGPVGADNVDPWQTVSDSLGWAS